MIKFLDVCYRHTCLTLFIEGDTLNIPKVRRPKFSICLQQVLSMEGTCGGSTTRKSKDDGLLLRIISPPPKLGLFLSRFKLSKDPVVD